MMMENLYYYLNFIFSFDLKLKFIGNLDDIKEVYFEWEIQKGIR